MSHISVMTECSNQRTSERAQLLAAMTHPGRVLNLDIKQSFSMPKSYVQLQTVLFRCSADINIYDINIYIYIATFSCALP